MEETWLPDGRGDLVLPEDCDLVIDLELLEHAAAWSRVIASAREDGEERREALQAAQRFEIRARALRQ
jgi:hypothetical protein